MIGRLAALLLLLTLAALPLPVRAQVIGFLGVDTAGGRDGLTTITTQTISSAASIQFTGLSSAFNTYLFNCDALLQSADSPLRLYVGEGGGPTWETASTYTRESLFTAQSGPTPQATNVTTANGLLTNLGGASGTVPRTLRLGIDNPSSSAIAKNLSFVTGVYVTNSTSYAFDHGNGYWNADTNAITGVELVPDSGTISGVCTLYGLTK